MTTPNEELIAELQQLANEIEISYRIESIEEAVKALQSQAERIAELERESETHSKAYGLAIVERDNLRAELGDLPEAQAEMLAEIKRLRAQLMEIEKTEPVLVVEKEPDYWSVGHFHEGSRSYIKPTKVWSLPIGTKLFTRPMPAQDVTELVEALEELARLGNGEHYGNSDGNMIARTALSEYKGAK